MHIIKELNQVSAGRASMSSAKDGAMIVTVTGDSHMRLNGVDMSATMLLIDGIEHPEVFSAQGYTNGSMTIVGSALDTELGSVYTLR